MVATANANVVRKASCKVIVHVPAGLAEKVYRMAPGDVIASSPYARVVEVADPDSAEGRSWVTQATFMLAATSASESWGVICRTRARDGRMRPKSRKVYASLVKTPKQARAEAVAIMRSASQCISVEAPLFVQARELLLAHSGSPPFELTRALLERAEVAERALRRKVSAKWGSRVGNALTPYFYVPKIAEAVRNVLFWDSTMAVPIATDGVLTSAYAVYDAQKLRDLATAPAKAG